VQLKVGGRLHLKLNISERPIANKYREGKMKRTLKRECKGLEIAGREAEAASRSPSPPAAGGGVSVGWARAGRGGLAGGAAPRPLVGRASRVDNRATPPAPPTEEPLGASPDVDEMRGLRPVLKHGPRSLTYVRVLGRSVPPRAQ
jgi:hypothetical protein